MTDHTHVKQQGMGYTWYDCDGTVCPTAKEITETKMPDSIALTRIHTPEDYWNRMALAEQKLWDFRHADGKISLLCTIKSLQLSDRYHERWTTTRKDYFG